MTEESFSNTSHLSATMTTEESDDVQTTATTTMSSSRGTDFYFACAVVVIRIVGAAGNGLILYAMIASKQHKKHFLIFNQNVFDLSSCLLLVIIYTLKLCNIHLTGMLGYWMCMLLLSENLLWCSYTGSVINLMIITVERYLVVVHRTWSNRNLRNWMKISAAVFAWIGAIAHNMAVAFSTSAVVDGVCYGYVMWKNRVAEVAHAIWTFVSFYFIVVCIFCFCYGRILAVVRHQASVMAVHDAASRAQVPQQMQTSVIKTMILVSAFFVVTWTPNDVYYLTVNVKSNLTLLDGGYYATMFISCMYTCANPFIYATKFDPVRRVLVRLIPCKKQSADGSIIMVATATHRTTENIN